MPCAHNRHHVTVQANGCAACAHTLPILRNTDCARAVRQLQLVWIVLALTGCWRSFPMHSNSPTASEFPLAAEAQRKLISAQQLHERMLCGIQTDGHRPKARSNMHSQHHDSLTLQPACWQKACLTSSLAAAVGMPFMVGVSTPEDPTPSALRCCLLDAAPPMAKDVRATCMPVRHLLA